MNRRSAIKGMGLLVGTVYVAPKLLGGWNDEPNVLRVGDIITNPRTGEKMRVTGINGINVMVDRSCSISASDRLLA